MPLRDQSAPTALDALLNRWIMYHGNPFYPSSDQGSNVDGLVMNEICLKFGIEKQRSSAYHSQGNGFAERNVYLIMLYSEGQLYFRKMFYWEFMRNFNYAMQLPLLSMQKILISVHKKYLTICFREQLAITRQQMQQQYNKNLCFFD